MSPPAMLPFSSAPPRRRARHRLPRAAATALIALALTGCGPKDSTHVVGAQTVFVANPALLPPGYASAPKIVNEGREDAVTEPTLIAAFEYENKTFLRVTGSAEGIERFLPEAIPVPYGDTTHVDLYQRRGWSYLVERANGTNLDALVMVHAPVAGQLGIARDILLGVSPLVPEERGDVTALTGGAPSETATYGSGDQSIVIRTFPGQGLDPILGRAAPLTRPVQVRGTAAYVFDPGGSVHALVLTAPSGDLVLITSPDPKVTIPDLIRIGADLKEA